MACKGMPYASLSLTCAVQVDVGLKQLTCNFMGGEPGAEHGLETFAEVSALQLKAQKPPKVKRNRRQRHQQSAEARGLYIVNVSSSTMQVGPTPPAVTVVAVAVMRAAQSLFCSQAWVHKVHF